MNKKKNMTKRFCFHYVMLGLIALGAAACSSGKGGEKRWVI